MEGGACGYGWGFLSLSYSFYSMNRCAHLLARAYVWRNSSNQMAHRACYSSGLITCLFSLACLFPGSLSLPPNNYTWWIRVCVCRFLSAWGSLSSCLVSSLTSWGLMQVCLSLTRLLVSSENFVSVKITLPQPYWTKLLKKKEVGKYGGGEETLIGVRGQLDWLNGDFECTVRRLLCQGAKNVTLGNPGSMQYKTSDSYISWLCSLSCFVNFVIRMLS